MRRDMNLCREIMRQIEAHPDLNTPVEIKVESRSEDEITYSLHLLHQAGLIEAIDASSSDGMAYIPERLTWPGQEFLDAARDEKIWRRACNRLLGAGGSMTFDLVMAALKAEISNRTGLDL